MALWIQNVTADPFTPDKHPSDYVVRINNNPPLASFQHCRIDGAAESQTSTTAIKRHIQPCVQVAGGPLD